MYRMGLNVSSFSIGLDFSMLWHVSRKSQELVHKLDVPSGSSSGGMPLYVHSYSSHTICSLRVNLVSFVEFKKFVRIVLFPGTFSRFKQGLYHLTP